MGKVFWILTGKCRKKQMNAAGQTGSPDPRVCLRQIRRNKKDDPLITWRIVFLSQKIRRDLCDDDFRHPGRRR